jgi:hypothetical protein
MTLEMFAANVTEIQKSKVFSIFLDSKPDVMHVDQLTFILQYIRNTVLKERFLQFIHIHGQANDLADNLFGFRQS